MVGSFLLHVVVWLGCYSHECYYWLDMEQMWPLCRVSQNINCVSRVFTTRIAPNKVPICRFCKNHTRLPVGYCIVLSIRAHAQVLKFPRSELDYGSEDGILNVLIGWAANRKSNQLIFSMSQHVIEATGSRRSGASQSPELRNENLFLTYLISMQFQYQTKKS